nr:MAG TPA: hypothetical protein [Caudoviricetes sp.]
MYILKLFFLIILTYVRGVCDIFNWVAVITYSVKLLTLGKATRAPYKQAPASDHKLFI